MPEAGLVAHGANLRRFRPYPEYRNSSIEWLGKIPAHWEVKRLRHVASVNPSRSEMGKALPTLEVSFVPMEAVGEFGGLDLTCKKELAEVTTGYTYFREGDVLLAKITPCFENGKGALACGLENRIGFGSTELHVIRPGDELAPHFLAYVTFADTFRRQGQSGMTGAAGQQRVPADFVKDFPVAIPGLAEQHAIGRSLDRETAKIDALVAKKERLIELLQEKRTALITRAVTKGLDPAAPMKDPGIEWLGEIPAHWSTERNRRLFRECERRSQFGDEELMTVSHITGVTRRSEKDVTMIEAESHEGYKLCSPGDLVINTMWAWMGALGTAREGGMISPSYNVYRIASPRLTPRYYDYLCRIPIHVSEIISRSKGIWKSRLRLYPESFYEISSPLPPEPEQQAICEHLDSEFAHIDRVADKISQGVNHLKGFRTALISAAVTGKIDVREEST